MRRPKLWLLILVLFTFAVYSPSCFNGYVYDDADIVRAPSITGFPNHLVASVQPLGKYYSSFYGEGVAGMGRGYRPTTVFSWALVHAATRSPVESVVPGGALAPPGPQHFVNILLHCLAAWLVFKILALLVGGGIEALLGTAVFGLHALRSDPVISLVGRGEILAFVFGATGLLCYIAALRHRGGDRYSFLAATGVALFFSFTSKESAAPWVVFLPLFAVALAWLGKPSLPSLKEQFVPWLVAVVAPLLVFLLLYYQAIAEVADFAPAYQSNPIWYLPEQRFATGVMLLGYGLFKILVPFSLACDYGAEVFTTVESLMDPRFLLSFSLLLGLLGFGVLRARQHPLLFLAVASFFGFAFLGSNIPFPIETIFGERLYYTPSLALSFVVAWLARKLRGTSLQAAGIGVLGLWCVIGIFVILGRNLDWRDSASLFTADAAGQPRSLSMLLAQRHELEFKDPDRLRKNLEQAYALNPSDPTVLREAAVFWNNVGQFQNAQKLAIEGLASQHPDAEAMRYEMHLNLARALEGQQQPAAAEKEFRAAVAGAPKSNPTVAMQFGEFCMRQRNPTEAKAVFRRVMRDRPEFVDAREMMLRIAQSEGDDALVEALVRQGLQLTPGAVVLTVHLGILARRQNDLRKAVRLLAESVPRLPQNPQYAQYWLQFAEVLAMGGKIEPARGIAASYLQRPMPPPVRGMFMELAKRLGM